MPKPISKASSGLIQKAGSSIVKASTSLVKASAIPSVTEAAKPSDSWSEAEAAAMKESKKRLQAADAKFKTLYDDESSSGYYIVLIFPSTALCTEFNAAHDIRPEGHYVDGLAFAKSIGTILTSPVPDKRRYRTGKGFEEFALPVGGGVGKAVKGIKR